MIFIGRIKQKFIKKFGEELVKKYEKKFSKDFDHNKEVLKELDIFQSRSTRNKIAGYIVKILKKKEF